jgi:hypothetical protein
MICSIIRAPIPWLLGGYSYTVQPRWSTWSGATHAGWKSLRSWAVIVPPNLCSVARMAWAVAPV